MGGGSSPDAQIAAITRETVLDGYYASGDFECFCFDRNESPWDDERDYKQQDAERVYPDNLIPEGTRGKIGRWRILVEFEEAS